MFDITKVMAPEKLAALNGAGMHKIAAGLEKLSSGRDVGGELDLSTSVQILGEKAFIKRAEHRFIRSAIEAYSKIRG